MIFKFKLKVVLLIIALVSCIAASGCQISLKDKLSDNKAISDSNNSVTSDSSVSDNKNDSISIKESQDESSSSLKKDEGPIPEISDPTPDNEGETVEGIFVYNGVAYEPFYGGETMAKYYADAISDIKKDLGDKIKVYNLIVPTHSGVDLPEKFKDIFNDQSEYINNIFSSYSADIIGISGMDKLLHHRNEYIYFNSDHHWTALGAYYAYLEFADAAGIEPVKLSDLKEDKIEGYQGSFASITGLDTLKEDYVTYYTSSDNIDCTKYDENGENPEDYMLIHSYTSGPYSYGVFLGGDTPLLVTKNSNGNGKKIAVIKESYGNAFSPFIVYTYSETHLIDFRHVNIDLKSYLEANGIDEVLFINNTMASATDVRVDEMRELIKNNNDTQTYEYENVESSDQTLYDSDSSVYDENDYSGENNEEDYDNINDDETYSPDIEE